MLLENIKLALSGLAANKMRTFLTMLGIIIGIASVIAIMIVSDAMNKSTMSSMGDMGANVINVYIEQKTNSSDGSSSGTSTRPMKNKDYFSEKMMVDVLREFKGQIKGISLTKSLGTMKVTNHKKYANIDLTGGNSTAISEKHLKMLSGRAFTSEDYEGAKKVAMVSDRYVNNMFAGDRNKALGQTVEVVIGNKYYSYTIIGVYEYTQTDNGYSSGTSQKDVQTVCYIPLVTAMQQSKANGLYDNFDAITADGADSDSLSTSIANYLIEHYYKDNDAYQPYAYSMKAQIQEMQKMLGTQKMAFMAIGAISLLVGGIGVMNIMIVSITERTREIGTRKALGATNGSIRLQFITEAIVVCVLGGVIGIAAGMGFGLIASKVLGYSGTPSVLGTIACLLFSMAFGVFFGYYPANKAARLNPIEALRYE
jgi:putative ABC transport system permease protein